MALIDSLDLERQALDPRTVGGFLDSILDRLPLTERAYHHLLFSRPLVSEIVLRLRRLRRPSARALVIGGNALLGHALLEMGFHLTILRFRQSFLTEELEQHVGQTVSAEGLHEAEIERGKYDAIVLPLVLEGLTEDAAVILGRLRPALAPEGSMIVAVRNAARLESRLAAVLGKKDAASQSADGVSLSWPLLIRKRDCQAEDISAAAVDAGLRVRRGSFVTAENDFLLVEPLTFTGYSARKLAGLLKNAVPSTRDVVLLELTKRKGYSDDTQAVSSDRPRVSVIVSARPGGNLSVTLSSLLEQTYPPGSYEVIVLHDGASPEIASLIERASSGRPAVRALTLAEPEGPAARNHALVEASGDICAHTDDACRLPPDWIESAVAWFDANTAVISGPVFPAGGSPGHFLEPPASRPVSEPPYRREEHDGVLFPASNSFYRRSAALAAGGFDTRFQDAAGLHLGWDSEFAWRLKRGGWRTRFREEVYAFRRFEQPGRLGWVAEQLRRAEQLPALVAAVPELRDRLLSNRCFASKQTMYFDMLLAGSLAAAARRRPAWLLLGLPWFMAAGAHFDIWPPRGWKASARLAARMGTRHLIWLAGYLRGSIKSRRLVL